MQKGAGINFIRNGVVVGKITWRTTYAGEGTKGSRVVRLTTGMDQFKFTGETGPSDLSVTWTTGGYNDGTNSNKPCGVSGSGPRDVAQWVAGGTAIYTISSAKTDGYSRDYISRCGIAHWFTVRGTSETLNGGTGVRFDSASYLGSNGAGIFDRVVPIMQEYATSSTRNGAVARHVQLAQTNPNATYPPLPDGSAKLIPGSIASGRTLNRLMSTWDTAVANRYADNRNTVRATCANLPHQDGEECDEYPFASTWEGAGSGPMFSVKYVDGTQNGNAGTDLNNWYVADRTLHFDKFYVHIS
ncbi:NucA/NucB deoxyribonuclease domain-containing protein [Streptomyces sp. NPDC052236]|uniref:NucA/NucB deoxyribonuclease domain-containing protein n=1 Tax=Streptomyces sp. NPDC052236 TaxID=3365686 RepID=UPI0037D59F40